MSQKSHLKVIATPDVTSAVLSETTEPGDRLASLLERRSELEAEIKRLAAPGETRSHAALLLAEAEAALAALDRSERGDWAAWANDPTGEQPTARHAERRELEQRRALATRDLHASEAAIAAVEGRQISLHGELRQLAGLIYAVHLEILMAEVPEIEALINDSHKLMIEQLARLRGLHLALSEEKAAAINRGDEANSTRLQEAMAKIDSLQKPSTSTNWGVVMGHAAAWRQALR